jgi:hypothetical protein
MASLRVHHITTRGRYSTLTRSYRRRNNRIKMWFVAGILTVAAVILGAIGIRIKTTRR